MNIASLSEPVPVSVSVTKIKTDPRLPSIWKTLDPVDRSTVRFVKPSMGREMSELFTKNSVRSPATQELVIRALNLRENTCIPFHRDTGKEKLYSLQGDGVIVVFLKRGGAIRKHLLNRVGDQLIIPVGMPHALYCTVVDSFKETCGLQIVLSSKKGETKWETSTPFLLENSHLQKEI
ncbi:MAG: hypothetical protein Q7R64_03490 [bacterium]|nr:hypothetical protein [bacterium]